MLASAVMLGNDCLAAGEPNGEVAKWISRGEEHAAKVGDRYLQFEAWLFVAKFYAAGNRFDDARRAVDRISDRKFRDSALVELAVRAVELGNADAAFGICESAIAARDDALLRCSGVLSEQHDFARAAQAARQIEDGAVKRQAWASLVTHQASAGRFQLASKTLEEFAWAEQSDGPAIKARLAEFIAEQKEECWGERASGQRKTVFAEIRRVGHIPELPSEVNIPVFKKRANRNFGDPWARTVACYQLARVSAVKYLRLGAKSVGDIRDRYVRLHQCAVICDFAIQFGDRKTARSLRETVFSKEEVCEALDAEDRWGLAPLAVMVFVRFNDYPAAAEVAAAAQTPYENHAWWVLGASAAWEGKTDLLEQQLEDIDSAIKKSAFCTGVAAGLREREQLRAAATHETRQEQIREGDELESRSNRGQGLSDNDVSSDLVTVIARQDKAMADATKTTRVDGLVVHPGVTDAGMASIFRD
jgi:hypothetical protein